MHKFRLSKLAAAGAPLALGIALSSSIAYADAKNPRGVYIWGDNSCGLVSSAPDKSIKSPVFIEYFRDKKLKDLALSQQVAVAVLANGKTIQWTTPNEQYEVLKGEKVEQVAVWDDLVIARSSGGSIYSWHASSSAGHVQKYKVPSLGWFEKVVDIKAGRDHVVALTSKGRALTALTREVSSHSGVLGLASHSALDPAPPAYEMHQVKLLHGKPLVRIAAGENHAIFQTENGEVFGCGSNLFGQLGLRFNINKPNFSVPTRIPVPEVADIAAGGDVTYFRGTNGSVSVVGNGINGLFGNGSFANVQDSPIKIPSFQNLKEFNEKTNVTVPIVPANWSISSTHAFTQLSNASRDWYTWGANLGGQLGNGKLSKVVKPAAIDRGVLGELVNANVFVAGNGVSGAFTR